MLIFLINMILERRRKKKKKRSKHGRYLMPAKSSKILEIRFTDLHFILVSRYGCHDLFLLWKQVLTNPIVFEQFQEENMKLLYFFALYLYIDRWMINNTIQLRTKWSIKQLYNFILSRSWSRDQYVVIYRYVWINFRL